MSSLLYWSAAVLLSLLVAGLALGLMSRHPPPELGPWEGRLRACPGSPNCVNTQTDGGALPVDDDVQAAWRRARAAVRAAGGHVEAERDGYLWATFVTPWFRFVDDLELHLDREQGVIHVRSASRIGHSDLGVNRRRLQRLRSLYTERE